MKKLITILSVAFSVAFVGISAIAHDGHDHMAPGVVAAALAPANESKDITVKGEIIDMACYIDHAAVGEKHAECARKCIDSGLPVGIKGEDGKVYLLIGEHKPINKDLVEFAAKTITVSGKLTSRDGFNLIENVEIVK